MVLVALASNLVAFLIFYKKPVFRKILSNRLEFPTNYPAFNISLPFDEKTKLDDLSLEVGQELLSKLSFSVLFKRN